MGKKNKKPKRIEQIRLIFEIASYIANIILVIYTILKG